MGECRHRWTEDYVCSVCGRDKQARLPLWVLAMKIKRGPGRVLIALWTFADTDTNDPRPIWPHNQTIADRAGDLGISTLSTHLAWLLSAGWIRTRDTSRREFELAWKVPFEPEQRTPGKPKTVDTLPKNRKASPDSSGAKNRKGGPDSSGLKVPKIGGGVTKNRNHTDQLPDQDRSITDQPSTPPEVDVDLFGDPVATPKRDPVAEVVAHYNARKAEAAEWAGLGKPTPIKAKDHRKAIASRLSDGDDADDGVERLRRVVAVQEAQARAHGVSRGPEDRKRLKRQSGWKYWRPTTLFTEKNVVRWLDRWDPDGDHEIWRGGKGDDPLPGSEPEPPRYDEIPVHELEMDME